MARLRLFGILLVTAGMLAVLSTPVQAQSPRISLVEEATNASCGPCAAQNPTFETWFHSAENADRIVTIIWHAYWPGKDVMNAANPEMNDARTSYYGITGVPNAVVNGVAKLPGARYGIGPASTAILDSLVGLADGTMSPITLTVEQTESQGALTADVTVTSTEMLTDAILQIVVVEGFHHYENAGYNGEKDFYRIARLQLPDMGGTALTLTPNESMTVPVSFVMDPEWNTDDMYIVAFVQDKYTKEVYQAAEAGPFDVLELEFNESESAAYYEAQENTAHEFTNSFLVPSDGAYGYAIESTMPEQWQTAVRINDQLLADGETIALTEGETAYIRLNITPAPGIQRYGTARLSIKGPQAASSIFETRLYAAPIDVYMYMHHEEEASDVIEEQYNIALTEAANWNYAFVQRDDEGLFDPNTFPIFVIENGTMPLDQSDVSMVKSYLDNGGRLLMLGSDVGYYLADASSQGYKDVDFMNQYLHADYVADDADPATANHLIRGFFGDPISNGLMLKINDSKVKNMDQPDVLLPMNDGIPCFYYNDEAEVAGVHYAGDGYAVVYYAFGFEGIKNPSWARQITTRTLEWLSTATSVDEPLPLAGGVSVAAYPNPTYGTTRIPLTLNRSQDVVLRVYNIYGQIVATVFEGAAQAGTTNLTFNAASLPPGAYVLRVTANGTTTSTMLSVVR